MQGRRRILLIVAVLCVQEGLFKKRIEREKIPEGGID